ncbi:MAG: sortase [Candidatus Levybacteria bacterium]|nr:sortase [Candidatus Levybacteria bacterium]
MTKYYYQKVDKKKRKKIFRVLGFLIFTIGFFLVLYIFYPLISWQIYFAPYYAQATFRTPIPKTTVVDPTLIGGLISQAGNVISGIDYTNAQNWFPNYNPQDANRKGFQVPSYIISIPKLGIKDAVVSTIDYDLAKHLIQYPTTAIPPEKGTAVIFGHSTLPQLFNPKDYKTIFATAYKLKEQDSIYITVNKITFLYKVFNISVVDPEDTSVFTQDYNNSYLTLVTCTPPGTVWKRLIIKSRLERI